jgi:hypothetical protein
MITEQKLKDFEDFKNKTNVFIKGIIPIKTAHSESIERYFDRFIKFPGALGIVSIFFANSDMVTSPKLAILGTIFITISILVALNVFRQQINIDKLFIDKVNKIEEPMVNFSKKLTLFSRDQKNEEKEKILIEAYDKVQSDYDNNPFQDNDKLEKKYNSIYLAMNVSFWMLTCGILLSVLSLLICI